MNFNEIKNYQSVKIRVICGEMNSKQYKNECY